MRMLVLAMTVVISSYPLRAEPRTFSFGDWVGEVIVSQDGRYVVATRGTMPSHFRVWHLETGDELFAGYHINRTGLAFSRDGKTLATAASDRAEITLWDIATGEPRHRFQLDSAYDRANCLAFSPDGKHLAVGLMDGTISVVDLAGREHHRHRRAVVIVEHLRFSSPGQIFAASHYPGDFVMWTLGKPVPSARRRGNVRSILGIASSEDGNLFTTTHHDGTLRLWRTDIAREVRQMEGVIGIRGVAFSPNGLMVASANQEARLTVWEVSSGKIRLQLSDRVSSDGGLTFTPDGDVIVFAKGHSLQTVDLSSVVPSRAESLDTLWEQLGSEDAELAYRAIRRMSRTAGAARFLETKLRPWTRLDTTPIQNALKNLDSSDFQRRERASAELIRQAAIWEPLLRKALTQRPTAETQRRLREILNHADTLPIEQIQALRAVEVLEEIGSPDGLRALRELSQGDGDTRISAACTTARRRLAK